MLRPKVRSTLTPVWPKAAKKNTQAYLTNKLKKDKITEFGELTANFTPEDWEGFQNLVSKSNIQDKELILSVLSMYKDPEQREKEIRNLSSIFDQLADQILPQLRKSRITASINVIGKSDKEIMDLAQSNPRALNVDELLYAATLTDNNGEKMKLYETATQIYPNDYRTFNDLGLTQYVAGDIEAAKSNFARASRLAPQRRRAPDEPRPHFAPQQGLPSGQPEVRCSSRPG